LTLHKMFNWVKFSDCSYKGFYLKHQDPELVKQFDSTRLFLSIQMFVLRTPAAG